MQGFDTLLHHLSKASETYNLGDSFASTRLIRGWGCGYGVDLLVVWTRAVGSVDQPPELRHRHREPNGMRE